MIQCSASQARCAPWKKHIFFEGPPTALNTDGGDGYTQVGFRVRKDGEAGREAGVALGC